MRVLGDRYELGPLLGSGGMALVHEATDRVLGRRVAVKLLHPHLAADEEVRARLLHEARSAASFAHPNAVAVFDVGQEGEEPFVVMEFVAGRTLAEELAERGALPVDESRHLATRLLAALGAAHEHGLVHRDVKPGNVLLSETGEVKLADFGIAKGLDDAAAALTGTGQVLGTPRYLAPERVDGGPATPRSDLYAVGVLLYEMLSGSPPFDGDRSLAIAIAHQRQPVPPLDEREPSVPGWLAAVVHRALAKDPQERYHSAQEMAAALRGPGVGAATAAAATVRLPADRWRALRLPADRRRALAPLVLLATSVLLVLAGALAASPDAEPDEAAPEAVPVTEAVEATADPVEPPAAGEADEEGGAGNGKDEGKDEGEDKDEGKDKGKSEGKGNGNGKGRGNRRGPGGRGRPGQRR